MSDLRKWLKREEARRDEMILKALEPAEGEREWRGAASDESGARAVREGAALSGGRWPGDPSFKAPRVRVVGDLAKIWMSDAGPVMAEYARAFGLTRAEQRALRSVVRRCDFVGGEDVDSVPESSRPVRLKTQPPTKTKRRRR